MAGLGHRRLQRRHILRRFTIEQLAGDLLPAPGVRDLVASAFNRNNATTDEGGAIAEEFRVEYAVYRVKTTSMAWLGLSMECAQCHEHKYDPISQEVYYKFFAYFNQSSDPGMQTRRGNTAPVADVPDYDLQARLPEITREREELEVMLPRVVPRPRMGCRGWLAAAEAKSRHQDIATENLVADYRLDGNAELVADAIDGKSQGEFRGEALRSDGKLGRCHPTHWRELRGSGRPLRF